MRVFIQSHPRVCYRLSAGLYVCNSRYCGRWLVQIVQLVFVVISDLFLRQPRVSNCRRPGTKPGACHARAGFIPLDHLINSRVTVVPPGKTGIGYASCPVRFINSGCPCYCSAWTIPVLHLVNPFPGSMFQTRVGNSHGVATLDICAANHRCPRLVPLLDTIRTGAPGTILQSWVSHRNRPATGRSSAGNRSSGFPPWDNPVGVFMPPFAVQGF